MGSLRRNPSDFIFVPVILSAEGRNDALFTSELTLTNRGTGAGDAGLDLHGPYRRRERDRAGTPGAGARQRIVPDVVEFLRERGLADTR